MRAWCELAVDTGACKSCKIFSLVNSVSSCTGLLGKRKKTFTLKFTSDIPFRKGYFSLNLVEKCDRFDLTVSVNGIHHDTNLFKLFKRLNCQKDFMVVIYNQIIYTVLRYYKRWCFEWLELRVCFLLWFASKKLHCASELNALPQKQQRVNRASKSLNATRFTFALTVKQRQLHVERSKQTHRSCLEVH